MTTVYDFSLPALDGETVIDLSAYRGQPILIANTASKCGFTPQYEGLQYDWSHYGSDGNGLIVIGVPSNDFGKQEPGDAQEIGATCYKNYGVTFPMAAKTHVRGPETIPLFRWLTKEGGILSRPRWNFYKYLIGRDGRLYSWHTPLTTPDGGRMVRQIQRVLLDR